jgi:hypothetical protein
MATIPVKQVGSAVSRNTPALQVGAPEKSYFREYQSVFKGVYSSVLFKQQLNISSDRRTT